MQILKARRLIIGDGVLAPEHSAVIIGDDGRIEGVISQAEAAARGPEVIDLGDATILPGLIDMHVHIGYWQTKSDKELYANSPGLIAYLGMNELKNCFANGVTTIRTVMEPPGLPYAIKMGYLKGFIKGPRYFSSYTPISSTGGHATKVGGMVTEVNSPHEFRRAVREQVKAGADWIKIMASHRGSNCEMTLDELKAAVDETHNWNKKICIHAGSEKSIEFAIEAGVDTIEHGTFMTVGQAERARDKGIAWIPTITPYWTGNELYTKMLKNDSLLLHQRLRIEENLPYFKASAERYQEYFIKLAETGIKIALGTDIVWEHIPITPVGTEIKMMHSFGMGTLEIIKCATKNAAELLGIDGITGQVREGLFADLLVVKGDLLEDIDSIECIERVFLSGECVYKGDVK